MTENEAINVLKMVEAHGCLVIEAKIMAIKALEEIQQYRAIGTVTEFVGLKTYEMNENVKKLVDTVAKTLVEAFENLSIEEVNMYQIGYNKAIDEFAEKLIKHISQMPSGYIGSGNVLIIAEQMKGGAV